MFKTKTLKLFLIVALGLLALLPAAVNAHGGGRPQLFREPAGPYLLSVWSLPEPLTTGEINLVVLVTENQEGAADDYVLDADINLRISRRLTSFEAAATHDQATNNLFYESYFDINRGGSWNVEVTVNGPAGEGQADFTLDIPDEGGGTTTNWLLYGGIGVALLVIAGLVWQYVTEEES